MTPLERMSAARAAHIAWAALAMPTRLHKLRTLRRVIARRRGEIVDTLCAETGKPPLDALGGDLLVTLEQMRFYEKKAGRLLARSTIGKPSFFYFGAQFHQFFEPYGVALIYAPFNYPFQLAMVPAITALFAGNAVVLKCSDRTPATARLIASLFEEAGFPEGLIQVVHDEPKSAAEYIDAGPDIVFFTGSSLNGRAVAERAARHVIPVILELGGKDAALVFSDCNLDRAIEGITYGAFSHGGQICVGVKRLYVESSLYASFVHRFVQRITDLRVGKSADVDLDELAPETLRARLIDLVGDALERGATLVYPQREELNAGAPILLAEVPAHARILLEESFGPVVCVTSFQGESQAIDLANSSQFALSASIWTADIARGRRIASALNAGTCAVNDVIRNIANPYAAFGGNRESGYGRYRGPQGLYAFSRIKTVMTSAGRNQKEMNWFPFTSRTFKQLDAIFALRHAASEWQASLRRLFFSVLFFACAANLATAKDAEQPHLLIKVTAPSGSHGPIRYLLFNTGDGFPNSKAHAVRSGSQTMPGASDTLTIDTGALPPGIYAVSVYQDVNGNGRLDSGFLGIPREPVGVSNNPKPRRGPPRFEECSFEVPSSGTSISITLVNPK